MWQERIPQDRHAATGLAGFHLSPHWKYMLCSAPTDFQLWCTSVWFPHPLEKPPLNCSVRENHIPLCREAATLLGSWKWHCLYLPLLLGGSQLEGRVCMAVSRGITENETKQKKLFTRCVLSFFFTVFYYILIKVKKWEANTDYTNKVTVIFFATSVISTLWMGKSRQGTALSIYLICGAFFREQMTNLFQHFR